MSSFRFLGYALLGSREPDVYEGRFHLTSILNESQKFERPIRRAIELCCARIDRLNNFLDPRSEIVALGCLLEAERRLEKLVEQGRKNLSLENSKGGRDGRHS